MRRPPGGEGAGGEPRRLTEKTGDYAAPQFTPDGATLLAQREAAGGRWVYNDTKGILA